MMWLMRLRYRMGMKPAEILKRYGEERQKSSSVHSRESGNPASQVWSPRLREDERRKSEANSTGSKQARKRS